MYLVFTDAEPKPCIGGALAPNRLPPAVGGFGLLKSPGPASLAPPPPMEKPPGAGYPG